MEKPTDDLLAKISDEFTNELELFLANNISDKEKQSTIVEFINRAFREGSTSAIELLNQSKNEFAEQAADFQKEFEKKLLDGQG
jgi:hypothetical protein